MDTVQNILDDPGKYGLGKPTFVDGLVKTVMSEFPPDAETQRALAEQPARNPQQFPTFYHGLVLSEWRQTEAPPHGWSR